MDGSSTTTTSASRNHFPLTTPPGSTTLCRIGSGAGSVVLDPDGGAEAESGRKLPASRLKGVVPQPNGRWGAQIYEKHQRVWLGTYNEEDEAARAYDIAALRFRGRHTVMNFKTAAEDSQNDAAEVAFLNAHSKPEIVDMLRKHTYRDELEQSKRTHYCKTLSTRAIGACGILTGAEKARDHLFEKVVTPSDVGKLNRLVIPKQHAENHFLLKQTRQGESVSACKGLLLNFEDAGGKVWRFRYSYWNSSQSYVLTKGWSRFVKEKSLRAGDIVSFQRSTGEDQQLHIDWKSRNPAGPVDMVRLFGVNIFKKPAVVVVESMGGLGCNGKRMELLSLESCISKKQRVIIGAL